MDFQVHRITLKVGTSHLNFEWKFGKTLNVEGFLQFSLNFQSLSITANNVVSHNKIITIVSSTCTSFAEHFVENHQDLAEI